jgi:diguanylate cyclase (GGDEF)-like protein
MQFTIKKKIALSIAINLFVGLLSLQTIYHSLNKVKKAMSEVTDIKEPISAAAYEMEINVISTGIGVLSYLDSRDAQARKWVEKDKVEFERFKTQYNQLAETQKAKELGKKLEYLYQNFITLGKTLMDKKDKQEVILASISNNFLIINEIVDEKIQAKINQLGPNGLDKVEEAAQMEANITEVSTLLGNYLETPKKEYLERMIDNQKDFRQHLELFTNLSLTQDEKQGKEELKKLFNKTIFLIQETLALDNYLQVNVNKFIDLRGQMDNVLDEEIQTLAVEELHGSKQKAELASAYVIEVNAFLIPTFIFFGLTAALLLLRAITTPLKKLMEGTAAVSKGDLSYRIIQNSRDEFAELAKNFNQMVAQLQATTVSKERLEASEDKLKEINANLLAEITERKRAEEQLQHDALHDVLTDLPNRTLWLDRLKHALERAKRHEGYLFAVLFLDLDRFKVVNDSLGHLIGDQTLIAFVHRLELCLRPGDTLARLGGDEFAILLDDIEDASKAIYTAKQIQKQLRSPFNLSGHEVFTSVSIGITLSTSGYAQPENLLRDAETAMYRVKGRGKACYEIFNRDMHQKAVVRLQLENDLRRAIERQEFELYYQPIVTLETGRVSGFEALVRWKHPNQGIVSPAEFIPIAEETGLIVHVGEWVLRKACRQMCLWQRQYPASGSLTMSVNLSAKQFSQPDLVEQVKQILQETGLDARSLKLEITESTLMDNAESATTMLLQLKALGIQLHMDDFGTGYSSLSHLQRFPIDVLKIDRSFISNMNFSGQNLKIVQTIVTLAHALGMNVTAEGVETATQLARLKELECKSGQGYFFSKPMNTEVAGMFIQQAALKRM